MPDLDKAYEFQPKVIYIQDLPSRLTYPNNESALNEKFYNELVSKLSVGDNMDTKFWWL